MMSGNAKRVALVCRAGAFCSPLACMVMPSGIPESPAILLAAFLVDSGHASLPLSRARFARRDLQTEIVPKQFEGIHREAAVPIEELLQRGLWDASIFPDSITADA